jgi:dipeptidyl aminopeptidase/acylaminoacyl peptidase
MVRQSHARPRALALYLLLLFVAVPAFAQQRGLQPEDSYRLTSVGGVALSPTAAHLAFTVTTVSEKENNRSTAVWLQELRNGRPVGEAVRFTDPTRNSTSPSWSPDGSVLAFTSRRGDEEGSVWFIRVGGVGGEAYRIEGVRSTPTWSPDGRQMAFTAEPPRDNRPNARALRIAPDAISQPLDPQRFDGYVITHRRYKRDGTVSWIPHPGHSPKRQLWVVPAAGGEARQVTDVAFNIGSFEWARDGSYFIFAANPDEDDDMSFDPTSDLWVVPAAGGEPRRVIELPGGQSAPSISPDGRRLAFLHTPEWNSETYLMVVDLDRSGVATGAPRNLTTEWNRTPGAPSWTADGRSIRWSATVNANTHVFEVPAAGGAVRQVTQGDRVVGQVSVSADGRVMAYTSADPVNPGDIHVADGAGRGETRVTSFNDAVLAGIERQPAERITWRVADGTEIEGWVIRPVGHTTGRTYPMVLNIHGGPHSAYTSNFSPMFHVLSAAGFYVFYVNPRGSTSYGNDFKHAIHAAWGIVDEEDFVTGVEAVLQKYPDIDRHRLGVTGGSYGGYMSNWLTARTDLFAASVTRASIASWEAMAGTTDSNQPHRAFDGAYHEQREIWRRNSPISYVENVRAPTLIIHGENDYRTPLSEAQMWFSALRKMDVPAEFVIYPRSSHSISEPWLAADNQARTRQWFVHWLIENPPTRTVQ